MGTYNTAWLDVQEWISEAKNAVEALPNNKIKGEQIFQKMSVTPRSLMGTLVLETGGLLIDHEWLRFLGSGSQKIQKNILDWNSKELGISKAFIVAYDVLGGVFAINGGAFLGAMNEVFYWQPDFLKWVSMKGTYSQLFSWALSGNLDQFYKNMRWPGWQDEVAQLTGDQGFSVIPFLWERTEIPITERSRRIVPITELWNLGQDLGQRISNMPPNTSIQLHFTESEDN